MSNHSILLIEEAQKEYRKGNIEKALELLLLLDDEYRTDELCIDIALLYDELNDYEKAKDFYLKALEQNHLNARAFYGLGTVYDNLKAYDESIAYYKEAINLDPNYYAAHFFVANCYDEQEKTNLAIYHYKKVIEINPNHFYAHLNLGSIYELQNKNELALDLFKQAEFINDNNHLLHFNFGVVYKKLGKIDIAVDHYLKSLSISLAYPFTFLNLGIIYKDIYHDLNKAINTYTKGINNHPNEAVLFYNRACAYALIREYNLAINDLSRAIKLNQSLYDYMMDDTELADLRDYPPFQQTFIKN